MQIPTTTVPLRADLVYKNALKALAGNSHVPLGDLVREAVDALYGESLKPYLAFFSAQTDHKNGQLTTEQPEPANERQTSQSHAA